MRVTIKDIAKETNLSIATVSLVLNNKADNISSKTRKLVIDTAKRLNYHPNQLAVSLVKKRTHTIGLIIPDIGNSFFSELANEINLEIQNSGWNIILCCTNDKFSRDLEYLQILFGKGVEGILYVMSSDYTSLTLSAGKIIDELPIPIVFVDRYDPMINRSSVLLNYKKGSYLATRHLINLGHKKIACITGPMGLANSNERIEGYRLALQDSNLPIDNTLVFEGDYRYQSGAGLAEKVLQVPGVSAVFAFNDLMAYGVMRGLKAHGVRIPEDISLVGFDDIEFSSMLETPLTTVCQPTKEIGRLAAQRLLKEIEKKSLGPSHHIILEPSLIIRSSTSPPISGRTEK